MNNCRSGMLFYVRISSVGFAPTPLVMCREKSGLNSRSVLRYFLNIKSFRCIMYECCNNKIHRYLPPYGRRMEGLTTVQYYCK
jgi:hypothetical protein